MKNYITLDLANVQKWKLSYAEAVLFAWMYEVPSWAQTKIFGESVFYFAAYTKACADLPHLTTKSDTMYRNYKKMEKSGLIEFKIVENKQYIKLTEKAKLWNSGSRKAISENNPGKTLEVGQPSDENSDDHPTEVGQPSDKIDIIGIDSIEEDSYEINISTLKEIKEDIKSLAITVRALQAPAHEAVQEDDPNDPFPEYPDPKQKPFSGDLTQDFVPAGITPSKKPFDPSSVKKRYNYPPLINPHLRNIYEEYADRGQEKNFYFEYHGEILWRSIKSDKGERPWDASEITKEYLNEHCPKPNTIYQRYVGVDAQLDSNAGYVTMKYHYLHLMNYDWLANPKVPAHTIEKLMKNCTQYFTEYWWLLDELYRIKMKRKEEIKMEAARKYLPWGGDPIIHYTDKEEDEMESEEG